MTYNIEDDKFVCSAGMSEKLTREDIELLVALYRATEAQPGSDFGILEKWGQGIMEQSRYVAKKIKEARLRYLTYIQTHPETKEEFVDFFLKDLKIRGKVDKNKVKEELKRRKDEEERLKRSKNGRS